MISTRQASKKQENKVAKLLGGRVQPNSGATDFRKGDVTTKDMLIECKTSMTEKKSVSIQKEWLEKNQQEAFAMNKRKSALCFDFGDDIRYYVIDEKTFKEMVEEMDL